MRKQEAQSARTAGTGQGAPGTTSIVALRDVWVEYGSGSTKVSALRGASLEVHRGAFVVFLGPSGSGKTTLLNVVGGLEIPTRGEVSIEGERIDRRDARSLTEYRRTTIGFVFQFFNLIPSLTALENVELAARLTADHMNPREALDRVGLSARLNHFPSGLSGGEQQRVAIARAVVRKPPILLCDEPTGELDQENGRRVLGLLRDMNRDLGSTVLLVTHNTAIATMADLVVRMQSGTVVSAEANAKPVDPAGLRW